MNAHAQPPQYLTVRQVADHWSVCTKTVYGMIRSGELASQHFGGEHQIDWPAVWACEQGPRPRPGREHLYRTPLMTRHELARRTGRSLSSVDRWLAAGLPTRDVGRSVRINEHDADAWLRANRGIRLFPAGPSPTRSRPAGPARPRAPRRSTGTP